MMVSKLSNYFFINNQEKSPSYKHSKLSHTIDYLASFIFSTALSCFFVYVAGLAFEFTLSKKLNHIQNLVLSNSSSFFGFFDYRITANKINNSALDLLADFRIRIGLVSFVFVKVTELMVFGTKIILPRLRFFQDHKFALNSLHSQLKNSSIITNLKHIGKVTSLVFLPTFIPALIPIFRPTLISNHIISKYRLMNKISLIDGSVSILGFPVLYIPCFLYNHLDEIVDPILRLIIDSNCLNSIETSLRKFLFTPMSEPPLHRDSHAIIAEYLEAEDRENFLSAIGGNLEEINKGISNQQKKELTELKKSNDCRLLFSDILDNPILSCEQQLIDIRNGIEIFGLSCNSEVEDIIKYVESTEGKEIIHQNATAEVKFAREFIDSDPYDKQKYASYKLRYRLVKIKIFEENCKKIIQSNISVEKKALKLNKVISKWHKKNAAIIKDVKKIIMMEQSIIARYLTDFINLEILSLTFGSITDISFLGELRNLKRLLLYDNNIADISPLYKLEKLECVSIARNPIPDRTCLNPSFLLKLA